MPHPERPEPPKPGYALTFDVEYPDRPLNRLTSFFRVFTVIPIFIVLGTLGSMSYSSGEDYATFGSSVSLLTIPPLLMILFRQKYPRWWFDWNRELLRFINRVYAYFALLNDQYPSTDEEQYVKLEVAYPDAEGLNRWLPLVKWFLAIPHYVVLVSSTSGSSSWWSSPGSRSCSRAATRGRSSTSSWASCAGATA